MTQDPQPMEQAPENTEELGMQQEMPEQAEDLNTEAPEETPAEALAPKLPFYKRGTFWLDTALVLAVIAVLLGGSLYIKQELSLYHVPSPLEIALSEQNKLVSEMEALQPQALEADEQLRLRAALATRQRQIEEVRARIAATQQEISTLRGNILALQHEIRQADKDARRVARQLLPGMPLGTVHTTDSSTYHKAVIRTFDGRRLSLSHSEGIRSNMDVSKLVKDTLPLLARYAFGLESLVDMSDFDRAAPAKPRNHSRNKAPLTPDRTRHDPPNPATRPPLSSDLTSRYPPSTGPGALAPLL